MLFEDMDNSYNYQKKLFWAKFELLSPEEKDMVLDKIEEFLHKKEENQMNQITSGDNSTTPFDEK